MDYKLDNWDLSFILLNIIKLGKNLSRSNMKQDKRKNYEISKLDFTSIK